MGQMTEEDPPIAPCFPLLCPSQNSSSCSTCHLACLADVCVGDAVAEMTFGGFADYAVLSARQALPIPHPGPEMVALLTSGLTASIGGSLTMHILIPHLAWLGCLEGVWHC